MKFVWDKNYSVKVKKFDSQHQHFFEITNSIYDLIQNINVSRDELFPKILELVNYGEYHLSSEEEAFTKFNYPDANGHLQEHALYRQRTQEYLERCIDTSANLNLLAKELADFASSWLVEHISTIDKKYSSSFEKKEIN